MDEYGLVDWVLTLVVLVTAWLGPIAAIYALARANLIFTIVDEGTTKAIMNNGAVERFVMTFTGHLFAATQEAIDGDSFAKWMIYRMEAVKPHNTSLSAVDQLIKTTDPSAGFMKVLTFMSAGTLKGIHYIGLPPRKPYEYEFIFGSVRHGEAVGGAVSRESELIARKVKISSVYVKDVVYGMQFTSIEILGNISADFDVLVTIRIKNPAKTLFRLDHWFDATENLIGAELRQELGQLSFEEARSGLPDRGRSFREMLRARRVIKEISKNNNEDLLRLYGIEVVSIRLKNVELAGGDSDLKKLTLLAEKARREAEVAIIRARGEATALEVVNEAAQKLGPNAMALEGFKAIKEAGANVTLISPNIGVSPFVNVGNVGHGQGQVPQPPANP